MFNVYIADLPNTKSRKFVFADDVTFVTQHEYVTEEICLITSLLSMNTLKNIV